MPAPPISPPLFCAAGVKAVAGTGNDVWAASDDELMAAAHSHAYCGYHAVGTCAMDNKPDEAAGRALVGAGRQRAAGG